VYLFHGNRWHGYPEGHADHATVSYYTTSQGEVKEWSNERNFVRTMESHLAYQRAGYRVVFVWEHEFRETQRARFPRTLASILHELEPLVPGGGGAPAPAPASADVDGEGYSAEETLAAQQQTADTVYSHMDPDGQSVWQGSAAEEEEEAEWQE
jgi:hypothetical protein